MVVLWMQRQAIRQEHWREIANMPDNKLLTFIFNLDVPNSDLEIINNHEICVKGKIYDIASKKINGNSVVYHCVFDDKEQKLITKVRNYNQAESHQPSTQPTRLIISQIIKIALTNSELPKAVYNVLSISHAEQPQFYCDPFFSIPLKPPKA